MQRKISKKHREFPNSEPHLLPNKDTSYGISMVKLDPEEERIVINNFIVPTASEVKSSAKSQCKDLDCEQKGTWLQKVKLTLCNILLFWKQTNEKTKREY